MKRKMANKWKNALRSGVYQQCRGVMANNKGYCCLGVLDKITHPEKSKNQLSVTDQMPEYGMNNDTISQFIQLNDVYKLSFEQIADRIDSIVQLED